MALLFLCLIPFQDQSSSVPDKCRLRGSFLLIQAMLVIWYSTSFDHGNAGGIRCHPWLGRTINTQHSE